MNYIKNGNSIFVRGVFNVLQNIIDSFYDITYTYLVSIHLQWNPYYVRPTTFQIFTLFYSQSCWFVISIWFRSDIKIYLLFLVFVNFNFQRPFRYSTDIIILHWCDRYIFDTNLSPICMTTKMERSKIHVYWNYQIIFQIIFQNKNFLNVDANSKQIKTFHHIVTLCSSNAINITVYCYDFKFC